MRRFSFHPRQRSGQTLIFVAMILLLLAFVVLWNFDLHKILYVKARSRNAGDAAALAGARWQATSLNVIGNLNVMQAVAITETLSRGDGDYSESEAIGHLEARLSFAGPLMGVVAAQQAAKNNGIYRNDDYTSDMRRHARIARNDYAVFYDSVYPAVSGSSWLDYADMLEAVADQGVAVEVENTKFYSSYADNDHLLLNPSFYDAIAAPDWCWFERNQRDLLFGYAGYRDWDPLPPIISRNPVNAELFSLELDRLSYLESLPMLSPLVDENDLDDVIREMRTFTDDNITDQVTEVAGRWYYYRAASWTRWEDYLPDNFPFAGAIKSEYNYLGADAAVRLASTTQRLTPGADRDTITWTAAAKPFGYVASNEPPHRFGVVLPAYREVGLIPVDASTAPAGGSREGWLRFIMNDLPLYLARGPSALGGCWYCQQLKKWEDPEFRRIGQDWLSEFSARCYIRPTGGGGGGGGGGGTRRGH